VKVLHQPDQDAFQREASALRSVGQHAHLVSLLATYQVKDEFCLIFPWAEGGTLRDLWNKQTAPTMDLKAVRWVAEQCLGISSALQLIHQTDAAESNQQNLMTPYSHQVRYGRHGDINPGNILWFGEEQGDPFAGTLKIADFGLADFRHSQSAARVQRSTIRGFTNTYAAPELAVEKQVSPSMDLWSLGCVFLELTIWILLGQEGLEEFRDKRQTHVSGQTGNFGFTDEFFELDDKPGDQLVAHVKASVLEVSGLWKHSILPTN
jgi:serine/threonine protein kinase